MSSRPQPLSEYTIRNATAADIEILVALTQQEAQESEGTVLSVEETTKGIRGAFANPPQATYWVAETAEGRVVASISVVTEWSNFHGGHYWWIQSLFIVPEHRGRGLVEQLLNHVAEAAEAAGAVDLRLYAHDRNERALRAYRRCGWTKMPYTIMRRPRQHD